MKLEQTIPYYPGCTLYEKARSYDASGREAGRLAGVELREMPTWTCCGTTYPLTTRKIVGALAPIRILQNVMRGGSDEVVTLCAFCYNVLKRANYAIGSDEEQRTRVNMYLKEEYEEEEQPYEDYSGQVRVLHLLEVFKEKVGLDALKEKVVKPLDGLTVAPFYGCMMLRPAEEVALDDPENPRILEDILGCLGCKVLEFPFKTECCGSYLTVDDLSLGIEASHRILSGAIRRGADCLVLSCPLCFFNMDRLQKDMLQRYPGFKGLPVLYFSQLIELALGGDAEKCWFDDHYMDPRPMLREKNIIDDGTPIAEEKVNAEENLVTEEKSS